METLLDVVKVQVEPGCLLRLEFENGEKRIFDMSAYMDKRPFVRLKDSALFALAKNETFDVDEEKCLVCGHGEEVLECKWCKEPYIFSSCEYGEEAQLCSSCERKDGYVAANFEKY